MTEISLSGGAKLEQRLAEIANRVARGGTLRVGFLEGATYSDGTPVATIAAIQNFGAPEKGIPPRPFFTKFIEDNASGWGAQLAHLLEVNDWDVEKALNLMGMGMQGQLIDSIDQTNEPPNSPVTNLLKQRFPMGKDSGMSFDDVLKAWDDVAGGQTDAPAGEPLVWTGHMRNSTGYEVVENG